MTSIEGDCDHNEEVDLVDLAWSPDVAAFEVMVDVLCFLWDDDVMLAVRDFVLGLRL